MTAVTAAAMTAVMIAAVTAAAMTAAVMIAAVTAAAMAAVMIAVGFDEGNANSVERMVTTRCLPGLQ